MVTSFLGALWYLYLISTAESIFDLLTHNDVATFYVSQLFSWASIAVLICTAVYFVRWYKNVYHNCFLIERENRVHSEKLAISAWFIPVVNLIIPLKVMRDVWQLSLKHAELVTEDRLEFERVGGLIGVWWTLWGGVSLLPVFMGLLLWAHDSETLFIDSVFWMTPVIIGTIFCLAAGLLLIYLVSTYSKIEEGLRRAVGSGKLKLLPPTRED